MKKHAKTFLGASLISFILAVPFASDANAYYYGGYRGGIVVGAPYYPYGYAPAYYPPPPPYAYAPPPYPYAPPPPYAYAPAPVVAPAYPLAGIGVGVHIR